MPIPTAALNILTFPQSWDPATQSLSLNILVLPKGDPLADFNPEFPDATLSFEARISSLDQLPGIVAAGPALIVEQDAVERRQFFDALIATFDQPGNNGFKVVPNVPGPASAPPKAVKKYLSSTYREATGFSRPRTQMTVTDASYECALRDGKMEKKAEPFVKPSREFCWEEIFSFVLRQPMLAIKLGLIYKTELSLPDPNPFAEGGYLYVDLAADSDYFGLGRQRFAARLPPLKAETRNLFAAVLFPVNHPGIYDQIFPEAELYDDGFAKIMHGAQPAHAAVLETSLSQLPAPKDIGIRLGWDDEQVAIWLNRQLGINAVDTSQPTPPSPIGVGGYRVDVFDEPNNGWQSLMTVEGDLTLGDLDIGHFDDELSVEVIPVNLENSPGGEFWLPSYFTAWAGGSLAVVDRTPFEIAGHPEQAGLQIYTPVGEDTVRLRYGNEYKFRVRLMDLTGGGPTADDPPTHPAPAAVATVPFRRYVAPKNVTILPGGGVADDGQTATFEILRPLLGYPDVVFTDKYVDAVALLKAQAADAEAEGREPMLPDPDVTQLQIEVQVRTLTGDPEANTETGQPFVPLYRTTRSFDPIPDEPLALTFAFEDMHNLTSLRNATIPDNVDLPLPTARSVRLVFTALGFEDLKLDYWGSQEARIGATPIDAYLQTPSSDELNLFQAGSATEIEAIFLQPDPPVNANLRLQMTLAGLRHEAPSDLMDRLAHQLDLPVNFLTLSSHPGRRTVYGCSNAVRHVLNPDRSSISFSSKADLTRQWIVAVRLTLDRDWSWYSPGHLASLIKEVPDPANPGKTIVEFPPEPVVFEVHRRVKNGPSAVVGQITMPSIINRIAAQNPDRNHTSLIFFDAYDPKPAPGQPIDELEFTYKFIPVFRDEIEFIDSKVWHLRVPITTPPAQVPKIISAGLAFSDYHHDDRYATTEERSRLLFLELDGPVVDKQDRYFARMLASGPDPMLLELETKLPAPEEPPLPIDPELIRAITPNQSSDCAGINAMQELIPSPFSDRHYLLPLPEGIDPESPELLGFFVYELRVGHDCSRWSTAHARFGHPLRVSGVQHPAPQLRCSVMRTKDQVTVAAPFAAPVWEGRNVRPPTPRSRLHSLLYAQVLQVNGASWRNVLLLRALGDTRLENDLQDIRLAPAIMEFSQNDILQRLRMLGLPLNAPLSVVTVEVLPEPNGPFGDPLGNDLGQVRILRTTRLTAVPEICPPEAV
jgi:hypothetical protein